MFETAFQPTNAYKRCFISLSKRKNRIGTTCIEPVLNLRRYSVTTTTITTPEQIRDALHDTLSQIGDFSRCAVLDYPLTRNLGDHLIWMGCMFYLMKLKNASIDYVACIEEFSESELEKSAGNAPILFTGGGSLGDLWMRHQSFREKIISQYRDRPIVILPQSLFLSDEESGKRIAKVFNSHPNLTICVRDNYSYELAQRYFDGCRVLKCPDLAFHLVGLSGLSNQTSEPKRSVLYHCRSDKELNRNSSPIELNLPNVEVSDWEAYKKRVFLSEWISYEYKDLPIHWSLQNLLNLARRMAYSSRIHGSGVWQEWFDRQKWQQFHPDSPLLKQMDKPYLQHRSWGFTYSGILQFQKYKSIVTNRLHGHILAVMMRVPHVFLANVYHKNQGFYETWTSELPYCRFVKDISEVEGAARELIERYPDGYVSSS